jgi:UPF0755 protein
MKNRGIVSHAWLLSLAARLKGYSGPVPAAGYRFPRNASPLDVAARLVRGGSDFFKLTVPEGVMSKSIPGRLQKNGYPRAEEFLRLLEGPVPQGLQPPWLPARSHGSLLYELEGYLLPDTYFVDYDAPPEAVVEQMLDLFHRKVVDPYESQPSKPRLSLHEIVTLASLVEREVMKPEERAVVAGVLLNRLERKQRLQCDATIQYALGYWKRRILYRDLKVASPYNTYRHSGLPPGPICNPGMGCIQAAMNPDRNPFFYYVADGSGGHVFSRTYDEHQAAIRRIRRRL